MIFGALLFCSRLGFVPFSLSYSHGKVDFKAHVNTMTWSVSTVESGVVLPYKVCFVLPLMCHSLSPPCPFLHLSLITTITTFILVCCTMSMWEWDPGCSLVVKHVKKEDQELKGPAVLSTLTFHKTLGCIISKMHKNSLDSIGRVEKWNFNHFG